MSLIGSSFLSHNSVLPVVKELTLSMWVVMMIYYFNSVQSIHRKHSECHLDSVNIALPKKHVFKIV